MRRVWGRQGLGAVHIRCEHQMPGFWVQKWATVCALQDGLFFGEGGCKLHVSCVEHVKHACVVGYICCRCNVCSSVVCMHMLSALRQHRKVVPHAPTRCQTAGLAACQPLSFSFFDFKGGWCSSECVVRKSVGHLVQSTCAVTGIVV
jgi:hypothetical protein